MKLAGSLQARDNFINHPEVEILPFLSEKKFRNLYNKASILILPLLEAGSSQTLNEAFFQAYQPLQIYFQIFYIIQIPKRSYHSNQKTLEAWHIFAWIY